MYYVNADGFLLKKDSNGNFYILSWGNMAFLDYHKVGFDEDPDLSEYHEISSKDVGKLIQEYLDDTLEKGHQLIKNL